MSRQSLKPETLAIRAIEAVVALLIDAGVPATRDAGAPARSPVAVLVGLPTLISRGLASSTFTVPVTVISSDPLNTVHAVDRLYAMADSCALALQLDNYSPSSFQNGVNAEPLPCVDLAALVTLTMEV
jgi:hypothetical protein